jgi:ribonuclease Y
MEGVVPFVVEAVLIAAISVLGTVLFLDKREKSRIRLAREQADVILTEAEKQRRDAALAAKDEAIKLRNELDREMIQRRKEIERIERRIEQKEETTDRKISSLEDREQSVRKKEQAPAPRARTHFSPDRRRGATGACCRGRNRGPRPRGTSPS